MSKAERVARFSLLLRTQTAVPAEQITGAFEVSRATFMRDLAYLRDQLGMPIEYDAGLRGYRLSQQKDPHSRFSELPGLWIRAEEAYALLTMYNVLRAIDPGFLVNLVSPIRRTLKELLTNEEFRLLGIDQKVFVDLPEAKIERRFDLTWPYIGLLHEQPVELTWKSANGSLTALCTVERLTLAKDGWHVTFTPSLGGPVTLPLVAVTSSCNRTTGEPKD